MTEEKTIDLDNDGLEDVGEVDLVFDVIGGDIGKRSARLIRAGGTLVSIVGPSEARPADGLAVDLWQTRAPCGVCSKPDTDVHQR